MNGSDQSQKTFSICEGQNLCMHILNEFQLSLLFLDYRTQRVQVFGEDGSFIKEFGQYGNCEGGSITMIMEL